MPHTFSACALLLALLPASRAEQKGEAVDVIVRMTVHPETAPKPALKYQLLPELREMTPGNPIFGYLKCFMGAGGILYNPDVVERREKWQGMPLKDFPLEEMRRYYDGFFVRQIDAAARLDTPDWQLLEKMKGASLDLPVPEAQEIRRLADIMQLRFRIEVAERRFDAAVASAKTMLAMARHYGEFPALIGPLIGTSVADTTIKPLEEMLQQPGCPNLFWALTDLPSPLVDFRRGLQGDRMLLDKEFQVIDEIMPMTEAQLQKVVTRLHEFMNNPTSITGKRDAKGWLEGRAKDEAHLRAARQRLIQQGLAEGKVKEFPALQVVLLDERYQLAVLRDEVVKVMPLPYWQAKEVLMNWPGKHTEESLLVWWTANLGGIRAAQVRIEQRFALLRHVEALRLYAAAHAGRLPKQLGEVKLPLPVDPVSGQPFTYTLEGDTATLQGSTIPSSRGKSWTTRYVVSIVK